MTDDLITHLKAHAIDPDQAFSLGVRVVTEVSDLPEHARAFGDGILPALVFPWRSINGVDVEQVRPAVPVMDGDRKASKYLWPKGQAPVLNVLRPVKKSKRVLIVEGTKQTHAVLRYADLRTLVVGIGGCSSWTTGGIANADLADLVDGLPVFVMFDADLDRNLAVWTAAKKLGEACELFGAESVHFVGLPARGSAGVDDLLAGLAEKKRAKTLRRLLDKATPKLPAKPKSSRSDERLDWIGLKQGDRVTVNADSDRLALGTTIVEQMRARWDGDRLFMFGRRLTSVESGEPIEVNDAAFTHLVHRCVIPLKSNQQGEPRDCDLSPATMKLTRDLADRSFTALEGVTRIPFVRDDGTVCATPGYDPKSAILLMPSGDLAKVAVPEQPTRREVDAAVALLLSEWLGDFPFATQADRANVLALTLTPFIRLQVPTAPLAVLDGLGPGVGKGLIADAICNLVLGQSVQPTALPTGQTEAWKTIHSFARSGTEVVLLDESHEITGTSLAAALTAPVIAARNLGASEIGAYRNGITWIAAGNHVQLRGDLFRRAYRIHLAPKSEGWENRSNFKHPRLLVWAREHRAELMSAVLTLIAHWHATDRPVPSLEMGFGSFEDWQHTVAGILHAAEVEGFLDNMDEWRDTAAVDRSEWADHLELLSDHFKDTKFTTDEASSAILRGKVSDPVRVGGVTPEDRRGYNQALGNLYGRQAGIPLQGLRLNHMGRQGHLKVAQWSVTDDRDRETHRHAGPAGPAIPPVSTCDTLTEDAAPVSTDPKAGPAGPATQRAVDFETASVDRLHDWEDPSFIRLLAWWWGPDGHGTTTDHDEMRAVLTGAAHLYWYNGSSFDIIAAERYLGMDLTTRSTDINGLDVAVRPPHFKAERYGLDALAQHYLGEGKTEVGIQDLADEFGGFDKIPLGDPRYHGYALKDAELTWRLAEILIAESGDYREIEEATTGLTARLNANHVPLDTDEVQRQLTTAEDTRDALYPRFEALGLPGTGNPWATSAAQTWLADRADDDWPRTAKGRLKVGKEEWERALAEAPDTVPLAELALEALALKDSFAQQLEKYAVDGVIRPNFRSDSVNGRWNCAKPNLLAAGKRSPSLLQQRACVVAPEGKVLLTVDLAGIDSRSMAGLSGDKAYLEAVNADLNKTVMGELGIDKPTAKALNYGLPYGRQAKAIAKDLGITLGEATDLVAEYFGRFPDLAEWIRRASVENSGRGGTGGSAAEEM